MGGTIAISIDPPYPLTATGQAAAYRTEAGPAEVPSEAPANGSKVSTGFYLLLALTAFGGVTSVVLVSRARSNVASSTHPGTC